MRTSVSPGSKQLWITSSHLASQWKTSRNNSKAAKLLRCPAVHHTTETGQWYLAQNYFTSAEETPYQPRPQIINPTSTPNSALSRSTFAHARCRACTEEELFFSCQFLNIRWLQNATHIVDERGLKVVEATDLKGIVPQPTTQTW